MLVLFGNVLLVLTAVLAAEFVVAYHRQTRGHWRRTEMGRHLMLFMAAIAAVLVLSAARIIVTHMFGYDDPTWFKWARLVVFVSIPIALGWRRWLLAKAQRGDQ